MLEVAICDDEPLLAYSLEQMLRDAAPAIPPPPTGGAARQGRKQAGAPGKDADAQGFGDDPGGIPHKPFQRAGQEGLVIAYRYFNHGGSIAERGVLRQMAEFAGLLTEPVVKSGCGSARRAPTLFLT
jgi:hypothetical protein